MKLDYGVFIISLDFELYWGMRDKMSIEQYRDNLLGVRNAIDKMLSIFDANAIHATWATVGFLFFNDLEHLKKNLPQHKPKYAIDALSPYKYIEASDNLDVKYHFAPEIIEIIQRHSGQEIGTHTFSHYYCLEAGQSLVEFKADISSAIKIAETKGISISSLVFARNQCNPEYLKILTELGIQCYRGTESSWIYNPSNSQEQSKVQRAIRLLDAYLNFSGHHTYNFQDCLLSKPFNFPSSCFLRPYSKQLAFLDGLKLKRITNAMDDAAMNNRIFHLWWHPHNFGINTAKNIVFLEKIVEHYKALEQKYGMKSLNMKELSLLSLPKNLSA
ncbi:MAG: hypothetical protein WCK96_14260 [Methylococcales bacterium]